MSDLFGAEMPLAVRFFLAFLIVLGLIGVTAWAVRRFGSARVGGAVRGRQPRLAVVDHASVDARRRLILVRRDNVEHLLMIGGPADVVVESNIVRATAAARETAAARPAAAAETLARPIALPEPVANGSWPLQPEPSGQSALPAAPRRGARTEVPAQEAAGLPTPPPPPAETPPRPQREALAALAVDLAAYPVASAAPIAPRGRTAGAARPQPIETRPQPHAEPRTEPRLNSGNAEATAAADQSLAEMAQRLEAALRKPKAADAQESPALSTPPHAAPAPEQKAETEAVAAPAAPPPAAPEARPARPSEAKPAPPEAKAKESKALYETLEQEMASLLGRQPSKTG